MTNTKIDTTAFWKWFDGVSDAAKASPVGKVMTAAGYAPFHNGGGTLAWQRPVEGGTFMICDEGNGLGDRVDETYLVGLFLGEHWEETVEDDAPNLEAAIAWCNEALAALNICRKWVKRIGGGFHPDTAGSRYVKPQSGEQPFFTDPAEIEEYEQDIERLFRDAPGDPYKYSIMAIAEARR